MTDVILSVANGGTGIATCPDWVPYFLLGVVVGFGAAWVPAFWLFQ